MLISAAPLFRAVAQGPRPRRHRAGPLRRDLCRGIHRWRGRVHALPRRTACRHGADPRGALGIHSTHLLEWPVQPAAERDLSRFELRYTADWQPTDLHIEATQPGRAFSLTTSFGVTTATNVITQNSVTSSKTDQISARTIVLVNNFYAGYVVLGARLLGAAPGTDLPAYIAPSAEVKINVKSIADEQLPYRCGPARDEGVRARHPEPDGPLAATAAIDSRGKLLRFEVPAAGLGSFDRTSRPSRRGRSRSGTLPTPT